MLGACGGLTVATNSTATLGVFLPWLRVDGVRDDVNLVWVSSSSVPSPNPFGLQNHSDAADVVAADNVAADEDEPFALVQAMYCDRNCLSILSLLVLLQPDRWQSLKTLPSARKVSSSLSAKG